MEAPAEIPALPMSSCVNLSEFLSEPQLLVYETEILVVTLSLDCDQNYLGPCRVFRKYKAPLSLGVFFHSGFSESCKPTCLRGKSGEAGWERQAERKMPTRGQLLLSGKPHD